MEKILQRVNTFPGRRDSFVRFIVERERIRIRKEVDKSARPWTEDGILHKGHFCNVRRADDRVTKWIGTWVGGSFQTEDQWFGYAIARWFNQPETLDQIPLPHSNRMLLQWNPKRVKKVLAKIAETGTIFRGAYIINGGSPGVKKYEAVVDTVLTPLWNCPPAIFHDSIALSWQSLRGYHGMGSFMAGQIVADWQTFGVIEGKDVRTWAPLGPGSGNGLKWIYALQRPPTQKEAVRQMIELADYVDDMLPKGMFKSDRKLTLHDIQNCLCEFSKYVRGYAKVQYKPHQETLL